MNQPFCHDSFPMGPARSVSPRFIIPGPRACVARCTCSSDIHESRGAHTCFRMRVSRMVYYGPHQAASDATPIARGNTPLTIPILIIKGGFARHVPSPCFTEIDLHEKSGGVPGTDPHPRRRKGSRNSEAKPQFGHRDGVIPCDRCCNPWVSCLLLPPPIQQPRRPRYPQRYTEGETLLREYLGPSTATKVDSKCCVETITATLSAVY